MWEPSSSRPAYVHGAIRAGLAGELFIPARTGVFPPRSDERARSCVALVPKSSGRKQPDSWRGRSRSVASSRRSHGFQPKSDAPGPAERSSIGSRPARSFAGPGRGLGEQWGEQWGQEEEEEEEEEEEKEIRRASQTHKGTHQRNASEVEMELERQQHRPHVQEASSQGETRSWREFQQGKQQLLMRGLSRERRIVPGAQSSETHIPEVPRPPHQT